MNRLLLDFDAELAAWAAGRIPYVGARGFGPSRAIGVADPSARKLLAAIVYHGHVPEAKTAQISIASSSPRWAQRGVIRAVLHYPFRQLGINKLWVAIPLSNPHAIRFVERIGFKAEATLGHHAGPGQHTMVLRMLEKDYRSGRWAVAA